MTSLAADSFRYATLQVAAFFELVRYSPPKVLTRLLDRFQEQLDGNPLSLPIPDDAPAEIPRLILLSRDQTLRVEMTLQRIDIRWQRQDLSGDPDLSRFIAFAVDVIDEFGGIVSGRPGRLALVMNRFVIDPDPGRTLAAHFCKPELLSTLPKGPFNRPENFEVHAHKRYTLAAFDVNSWVRCKSGFLTFQESRQRIILVEEDLNTLAETISTARYGPAEVRAFLAAAQAEMESILEVYFGRT